MTFDFILKQGHMNVQYIYKKTCSLKFGSVEEKGQLYIRQLYKLIPFASPEPGSIRFPIFFPLTLLYQLIRFDSILNLYGLHI